MLLDAGLRIHSRPQRTSNVRRKMNFDEANRGGVRTWGDSDFRMNKDAWLDGEHYLVECVHID